MQDALNHLLAKNTKNTTINDLALVADEYNIFLGAGFTKEFAKTGRRNYIESLFYIFDTKNSKS